MEVKLVVVTVILRAGCFHDENTAPGRRFPQSESCPKPFNSIQTSGLNKL